MQIVINIPEHYYENNIKKELPIYLSEDNIVAILPKGHGRISDMDEAIKCIEEVEGEDAIWAIALIEWACGKRTIIEADKENGK